MTKVQLLELPSPADALESKLLKIVQAPQLPAKQETGTGHTLSNADDNGQTVYMLLSQKDENLPSWLPVLNNLLLSLNVGVGSERLRRTREAIIAIHESHLVWRLRYEGHPRHVWTRFLQLYFSIPDRLATVIEEEMIFSPSNFVRTLLDGLKRYDPPNVEPKRLADVLWKCHSTGRLDIAVEWVLGNSGLDSLLCDAMRCLDAGRPLQALWESLTWSLHVHYDNDPARLYKRCQGLLSGLTSLPAEWLANCPFTILAYLMLASHHVLGHPSTHFKILADMWSCKMNLHRTPIHEQRQIANSLLVCLSFISREQHPFPEASAIIDGIQRRLASSDQDLSEMAKVVAESLALCQPPTETPLCFELASNDSVRGLRLAFNYSQMLAEARAKARQDPWVSPDLSRTFPSTSPKDSGLQEQGFDEDHIGEPLIQGATPPSTATPLMIITRADEEARNAKIKRPRYLRDCLAYLRCSDDPNKLELALCELPLLLNSPSPILLAEIGPALFCSILHLNEDFNIPNFDLSRRSLLCTLLSLAPESLGAVVVEETMGRRCSLGQKLEAITACMAAIKGTLQSGPNEPRARDSNGSAFLGLFNFQMGFVLSPAPASTQSLLRRRIINSMVLPLLRSLGNCSSTVFSMTNDLLLEKVLYLTAYSVYQASTPSIPEYALLQRQVLRFIDPILSKCEQAFPRPLLSALVTLLNAILCTWSDSTLSPLAFLEELHQIAFFFQSQGDFLLHLDPNYLTLAAVAQMKLQELTEPHALLASYTKESALRPVASPASNLISVSAHLPATLSEMVLPSNRIT